MISLKRHLLLLVLGALLPLLVVAVALTVLLVREDRSRAEAALHENARLLAGALDAELNRSITAMQTMSRNESLRRGELARFYAEAVDARDALGFWDNVILLSPTGEHLLNLLRPYGTRLPPVPNVEGPTSAARTRAPFVSNALRGRVDTDWLMFMNYPVVVGDEVRYVLGVTMNYRYWSRWLTEHAPKGFIASIIDRDGIILARTADAERLAGQPVQPWFRQVLESREGGTTRGRGVLDPDVVVAFHRSEVSGWQINLLTSGGMVDAPGRRTALVLAIGVALALAIAVVLALSRAAVLTRGIGGLQAALEGLKGERPQVPASASPISEVNAATEAARDTAAALRARQDEIDALQADLRTHADALGLAMRGGRMGAWSRNLATNEVWFSRELEAIFGLPPGGFAGSEENFFAYVHAEDRDAVRRALGTAIEARTDYAVEFRFRDAAGHWRWMDGRGRAVYGEDDRPTMLYGVGIDITERKRAEEELKRLNEELWEADRRKDEFLATLAHELRNPLAPIRSAAEVLRHPGLAPSDADQAREIIERQARHMTRMVDDLLELGRITHGELQLKKETVAVADALRWALEAARDALANAGVSIEIGLPPEPAYVEADPTRLVQILVNLLGNAAKFTPRGGHVWLRAWPEDRSIAFSVRDDGIGIEPREMPRLFQMFSHAAPALERSGGGLGIGLALVRGLVERHGGTVEAKSEGRGRGAEFVVRLPAAQPPQASARETPDVLSEKKKIVVADDNRDAADSLASLLRAMGHEVRVAYDGEQALEAASDLRPDAMIVDIGMPRTNGYDVATRARKSDWGRGATLIALTGRGQSADKARAAAAGFDHHVTKPVEAKVLEALLAGAAPGSIPP